MLGVSRNSRHKSPYLLTAIDFGYTLLASLGIFGWLGWWLDGRVHTSPLFLIGGIFLGLAVAFSGLLRRLGAIERAQKAAKSQQEREPPDAQP